MDRVLSFEKVDAYMEELAAKNHDIKGYCGTSEFELNERLVDGSLESPFLVFYGYRWKLDGSNQRTFNTRTIDFSILFTGISHDDAKTIKDAISTAEKIGLEVLSRIHVESKMNTVDWLYNNFIKESTVGETIEGAEVQGCFGMDFHFDLKVHEPLQVTQDRWSDGNIFCVE